MPLSVSPITSNTGPTDTGDLPDWNRSGGGLGGVPGPIAAPSPFGNLSAVYPNLSGSNSQVSGDIMAELKGQLSPETLANLQRASAQFGVGAGMPGSGLAANQNLLSNVLTTQDLQRQGIGDYLSAIQGVSKTQTLDPAIQAEIAARNSNLAAAPNPGAAAAAGQNAFLRGLGLTRGGLPVPGASSPANPADPVASMGYPNYPALGPLNPADNSTITTPYSVTGQTEGSFLGTAGGNVPIGTSIFPSSGSLFDVPDFNAPGAFDPNQDYFGLPGSETTPTADESSPDALYDLSATG